VWGNLQSVVPAITVPAWACAVTGRDPGELGIYGFRKRTGHGYDEPTLVDATDLRHDTVWDVLSRAGKPVIVLAVPPSYPPVPVNGCLVGCLLTPDTTCDYTHPKDLKDEIAAAVGDYRVDVANFRSDEKDRLQRQIVEMTRTRFRLFRHLLQTRPWSFAMMVEMGPDRMHHAFWRHFDESHPRAVSGSPFRNAVRDYYRLLDREIGETLKLADDGTAVMVLSDHGAKPLHGTVCINEYLMREEDLVLKTAPSRPTPLALHHIDWSRTRAWAEGGYCGRVYINRRGREPRGTVDPDGYDAFRDRLAAGLEAIGDEEGNPMKTRVFKPESLYRECRNIPPDLVVYFDDLNRRAVSTVGTGTLHAPANDTGPDDTNHDEQGIFILKSPGLPGGTNLDGLKLIDCGPAMLNLLGFPTSHLRGTTLPGLLGVPT
jgi:predicted AlkP superfamily phosphohydrolase/phosphomutase